VGVGPSVDNLVLGLNGPEAFGCDPQAANRAFVPQAFGFIRFVVRRENGVTVGAAGLFFAHVTTPRGEGSLLPITGSCRPTAGIEHEERLNFLRGRTVSPIG